MHAVDCAECDTTEGHVDRIEWSFLPVGGLTGEERKRLPEIARRCPVHRTLSAQIDIRPPLAWSGGDGPYFTLKGWMQSEIRNRARNVGFARISSGLQLAE